MIKSIAMDRSNSGQRPSFFWQGMMILLPVAVLAVVALFPCAKTSKPRNKPPASRAADNAQSLAGAMSVTAGDQLGEYQLVANILDR